MSFFYLPGTVAFMKKELIYSAAALAAVFTLSSCASLESNDGDSPEIPYGRFAESVATVVDSQPSVRYPRTSQVEGSLTALAEFGPGPFSASEFDGLISDAGLVYRVVSVDGRPLMSAVDFRPFRVNVDVVDSMVVSLSHVG